MYSTSSLASFPVKPSNNSMARNVERMMMQRVERASAVGLLASA